jgi:hypothetical protein
MIMDADNSSARNLLEFPFITSPFLNLCMECLLFSYFIVTQKARPEQSKTRSFQQLYEFVDLWYTVSYYLLYDAPPIPSYKITEQRRSL